MARPKRQMPGLPTSEVQAVGVRKLDGIAICAGNFEKNLLPLSDFDSAEFNCVGGAPFQRMNQSRMP